ncbi:hypothetical protein TNCV_2265101 [Trichonephila clavipes]|nr:hypothetical protein TNCV_2265101 [Trichonephila clavipes]
MVLNRNVLLIPLFRDIRQHGLTTICESSDALTDDSSDEGVPVNNLLEFSSDSEKGDQETEQDLGCSSSYSENTVFLPQNGVV